MVRMSRTRGTRRASPARRSAAPRPEREGRSFSIRWRGSRLRRAVPPVIANLSMVTVGVGQASWPAFLSSVFLPAESLGQAPAARNQPPLGLFAADALRCP